MPLRPMLFCCSLQCRSAAAPTRRGQTGRSQHVVPLPAFVAMNFFPNETGSDGTYKSVRRLTQSVSATARASIPLLPRLLELRLGSDASRARLRRSFPLTTRPRGRHGAGLRKLLGLVLQGMQLLETAQDAG